MQTNKHSHRYMNVLNVSRETNVYVYFFFIILSIGSLKDQLNEIKIDTRQLNNTLLSDFLTSMRFQWISISTEKCKN